MDELLSIGQVADAVGLTTVTLRHYEDVGLLGPTTRQGGQRRYRPHDVRRLRVIAHCRQAGFTLAEIAELLSDDDWERLAQQKREELRDRIRKLESAIDLIDAALVCGCSHLEGCERIPEVAHPNTPRITDPTRPLSSRRLGTVDDVRRD